MAEIAQKALDRKTGARGLRSIMEEAMLEIMYDIPSEENICKCIITKDSILKKATPELIYKEKKPVSKELTESVS